MSRVSQNSHQALRWCSGLPAGLAKPLASGLARRASVAPTNGRKLRLIHDQNCWEPRSSWTSLIGMSVQPLENSAMGRR